MSSLVLVTGASGYIAGHVVKELLEHGYAVRGTVRDVTATERVAHLRAIADDGGGKLEFVAANLTSDDGWAAAVDGCDYVIHVASPIPSATPKDPDELVRPAVDGTLRVLNAAAAAPSVKRVVLTSSIAAIAAGRDPKSEHRCTEDDWSNLDNCEPYPRSKTLAERAAWEFMDTKGTDVGFDLVAVNPGLVLGPLLNADASTSVEVVKKLINREIPGTIALGFATVDVRDVAAAHRLAMETPAASGNRYIVAGDHAWMRDMAETLAAEFGPRGYRVPTRDLPHWLVWTIARFDKTVRLALDMIGARELVSADKAKRELGWTMRPLKTSLVDTADSMIDLGLVTNRRARA
ncbi:MAG TPA: aldehyde reductase [Stackebrandtia sp.]|jgi:nucleoside-diphosphate-sugar epimerase|uniref:SDR family oxidoreductase n=1 Tax=Stackebrandtia sp. TaxID=2023065 RepID=UPI002D35BEC3|nr:aldehyde reductase [Stackebrandtia sp.]HZE38897.1 aldehyde reductase [Stackebrandtia sp.]